MSMSDRVYRMRIHNYGPDDDPDRDRRMTLIDRVMIRCGTIPALCWQIQRGVTEVLIFRHDPPQQTPMLSLEWVGDPHPDMWHVRFGWRASGVCVGESVLAEAVETRLRAYLGLT